MATGGLEEDTDDFACGRAAVPSLLPFASPAAPFAG